MNHLIGVSLNIGSHAWYVRQVAAERRAAELAGASVTVRDAKDRVDQQVSQVRELIELGADAIILSATRPEAIGEALDECRSRGVAVIGESIALDHPAVVAEVRVDDTAAGVALGSATGAALEIADERIPGLVAVGFSSLRESHDRERGFLEGLRRVHPHAQVAYIDGRAQVDAARAATLRVMGSIGADRRPDALFGVDDELVIGARQAFEELGVDLGPTIVATFGISPPGGPALIDDGIIDFGVAMFPEWHGQVLVDLALLHLDGRDHPRLVNPPSAVVTASGTATGWDRFYRRDGETYELDVGAVRALGGDV